ncbi:MAG: alanine racemase [Desulfobacterales bacterium]|nr:alanine racemase [Desulfobacterales bacterium]
MNFPLVWVEVNLKAIADNVRELRRITSPSAQLMAVIKANAYGHGAVETARTALKSGATFLGVARLNEGIQIRNLGLDVPVLILGYTPSLYAEKLIEYDLIQTVTSFEMAENYSRTAIACGKKIKVHLKVETGMGRLGLFHELCGSLSPGKPANLSAAEKVESIARFKGIELNGIFTHFATADSIDKSYAYTQFKIFMDFLHMLYRRGLEIPLRHAANSAAIIEMPETHLDLVRAGISIYGLYPSDEVEKSRVLLQPAMELKTRIIHLKKVPAGFKISYGSTYQTKQPTTIVTVPIGYADGYNRLLSSRGHMLVRGQRAPVVGRICMDLTMLDVGHIPEVDIEDEVVIFGKQGNQIITIDEIASNLKTISYEIVSTIADRVPRYYL